MGKKILNRKVMVIFTLWLAYAALYLGRHNMAMVLPVLEQELGWSPAMSGLLTGIFFWCYAVGQLINGYLGDRWDAKRIVLFGLMGSCVANALFPFVSYFWLLVLLWAFNGYVQSSGWGPILKIASHWTEEQERTRVAGFLATSGIAGFFISWAVSGYLLLVVNWYWVFVLPALGMGLVSVWWFIGMDNHPIQEREPVATSSSGVFGDVMEFIKYPGVVGLGLVSLLQGMIRNGIILWTPTLLANTLFGRNAVLPSLLIPFCGLVGIGIATRLLLRLKGNDRAAISILLGLAGIVALFSILALVCKQPLLLALAVALTSALTEGANTILLTSIPLKFAQVGKQSTLAGYLDFACYVGGALMSVYTGLVLELGNWNAILLTWAGASLTASLFTSLSKFQTSTEMVRDSSSEAL